MTVWRRPPLRSLAATNGGLVPTTWTVVAVITPEPDPDHFRTRCTRPSCALARDPILYQHEETARVAAQEHADRCDHDVIVEQRA